MASNELPRLWIDLFSIGRHYEMNPSWCMKEIRERLIYKESYTSLNNDVPDPSAPAMSLDSIDHKIIDFFA
jgi:hypothetical protein